MRRPTRAVPVASPLPKETLDAAMLRVAGDYAAFVASWPRGEAVPDPKAFAAHQAAARAALAHMQELAAMSAGDAKSPEGEEEGVLSRMREEMAKEGDG
ncbi:hypothetical protein ACLF3G_12700 [Falsiroseomonas sp. HC035]|uniref:hypothetical protein n=1 Tax=Falsiroseomonas sp. HC035 TaxID=3390999 RepID=UPI003D316635